MVFVIQDILEIVVQGIGVAVLGAESLLVFARRGSGVLAVLCRIFGGKAVEMVVALTPVFHAAFYLEPQVGKDFPIECSVGIQRGTESPAVVVGNALQRLHAVAVEGFIGILVSTPADWNRSVLNCVFETSVAGCGTFVIEAVGSSSAHIHAGITDARIDARSLGRLEVGFEIEIVAAVVGSDHDGTVADMGIAKGPVVPFAAAGDRHVCGES